MAQAEPPPAPAPAPKKKTSADPFEGGGGGDDEFEKLLNEAPKRSAYVPPAPGGEVAEKVSTGQIQEAVAGKMGALRDCLAKQQASDPEPVVRVTADLRAPVKYEVQQTAQGIVTDLLGGTAARPAAAPMPGTPAPTAANSSSEPTLPPPALATISLTLLRASYEPDVNPDEGLHHFTYSIYPHVGNWRQARTICRAAELNQPLQVTLTSSHPGHIASGRSLIECQSDSVLISAVKLAEDQPGQR